MSGIGSILPAAVGTIFNVPSWIFWVLSALFFIVASFRVWLNERKALEKAQEQLRNAESVFPRILLAEVRVTPLLDSDGQNPWLLAQAWFKNSPLVRSAQSTAKAVAARIRFGDSEEDERQGEWAIPTGPGHSGFSSTQLTVDILPNDIPFPLNIALKYGSDDDCYIFSTESVAGYPDGRDPRRKIPRGSRSIHVHLMGVGVDRVFVFTLKNPGVGGTIDLLCVSQDA